MLVTETALQYELCVNVADAAYGIKHWISNGTPIPNLIHVARLRNNRILYRQSVPGTDVKRRGRPTSYGAPFRLSDPPQADEETEFEQVTPSGKRWTVRLSRWKNLLTNIKHIYHNFGIK